MKIDPSKTCEISSSSSLLLKFRKMSSRLFDDDNVLLIAASARDISTNNVGVGKSPKISFTRTSSSFSMIVVLSLAPLVALFQRDVIAVFLVVVVVVLSPFNW